MLYVKPVPVGAVTVIAPVVAPQVGCVILNVGAAGVAGCALITADVAAEVQPDKVAVTLYDPGTKFENTPVVLIVLLKVPPFKV